MELINPGKGDIRLILTFQRDTIMVPITRDQFNIIQFEGKLIELKEIEYQKLLKEKNRKKKAKSLPGETNSSGPGRLPPGKSFRGISP